MKRLYGIYVPGLGDDKRPKEAGLSDFWKRWHNIDLQYFPVKWAEGRHFQPKLNELLKQIDSLHSQHGRVSLVGTSAGASAVLNAYARRPDKIDSVVIICGKVLHPEGIGQSYRDSNPAFIESMDLLADSLNSLTPAQRQRILSRIPIFDGLVPLRDMRVLGAKHSKQFTFLHAPSIFLGMTLASRPAARFIKSR